MPHIVFYLYHINYYTLEAGQNNYLRLQESEDRVIKAYNDAKENNKHR